MNAPLRLHQDIVFEVAGQVWRYLQGKPCKGYVAPFDVRLPRKNETDDKVETVVQPDLSVICDMSILDKLGCRGAPRLDSGSVVAVYCAKRHEHQTQPLSVERCKRVLVNPSRRTMANGVPIK
jgi:hypothetical protein